MTLQRWTILDILKWSEQFLKDKGFAYARSEAEQLLMAVLKLPRVQLYVQFERPLSLEERALYKQYILRRAKHEPVQYITNIAYFMGLEFYVDPRVLIPRFDTETLLETVVSVARRSAEPLTIIDVGTGSGCLALGLKKFLPEATVLGLDLSPEALAVARKNAERHQLQVEFLESDLLESLVHRDISGKLFIVSNPPYIAPHEYAALDKEVRDHEPRQALVAEDNGLYFYQNIVRQAALFENCSGIFFEVGYTQALAVQKLLQARFPQETQVVRDIGGKERVVYTVL